MQDVLDPGVISVANGRDAELPATIVAQALPAPIAEVEGGLARM